MDSLSLEVDETEVQSFFSSLTLDNVIPALVTLAICLVVVKFLLRAMNRMLEKSHIEKSLHGFLRTLGRIGLYGLAILITADQLGVQVSSLVAVFSVAALAVSLALQGALSNVASGIVILSSHPFKVGDYVEIDSVSGTVTEINLTYTMMATADNKMIYIPNSTVTSGKVTNYTVEGRRRVDITVTASYDAPLQAVKDALLRAAASQEKILTDPAAEAHVSSYEDSNIQYILRAWVETADYWPVYYDLLEQVKAEFDAAGIEMTYPHLNVHLDRTAIGGK